jgi:hypothetical protein
MVDRTDHTKKSLAQFDSRALTKLTPFDDVGLRRMK